VDRKQPRTVECHPVQPLKPADLTAIAAAAFPRPNRRAPRRGALTAEQRDALILKLMVPLLAMALRLTVPDHDIAEELRSHVLYKCELGCYDPRKGSFAAWARTVMTRHLITLLQSRDRAAGGEETRLEPADTRQAPEVEDPRAVPFTRPDLDRIRKWSPLKRVLLLTRSLLWAKLPAGLWAASLAAVGLPASFPGPAFEDMSVVERNEYLARALRVRRNTVHVRMGRWRGHLLDLRFVRELSAGR
jgi:DNA-directed RNA polymerase specialized sigma24 family protein